MQLRGVLTVLLLSLCIAHGLRCYSCVTTDPKNCTNIKTCAAELDRCSSTSVNGFLTKTCMTSSLCVGPIFCCEADLCNGARSIGTSVALLLVTSAIIKIFI
ncbi:CD59 glycoprotein-like [Betta splendens]|uniref:CD59 glycoprotein-like n=1 Tax=Betta splendens TaxID=158456 RepID=A0A9W2Y1F1_BETSP|nr:CD59 glycoprotein-like [Betta splendens]